MIPPSQMLVSETLKIIEIPMVVDVMDARRPKMQENGRDKVIACDRSLIITLSSKCLSRVICYLNRTKLHPSNEFCNIEHNSLQINIEHNSLQYRSKLIKFWGPNYINYASFTSIFLYLMISYFIMYNFFYNNNQFNFLF